jgi:alkylation response protein AidB-like acyl-CoA dehydrogenase
MVMPSISACYLGIAQAARDYVVKWANQRTQLPLERPVSHYPGNQFLAAEMEVGLRSAHAMLIQTASSLSESSLRANPPLMDVLACQHFVTETAVSVIDKAMRIAGGAAISRSGPLEQFTETSGQASSIPLPDGTRLRCWESWHSELRRTPCRAGSKIDGIVAWSANECLTRGVPRCS